MSTSTYTDTNNNVVYTYTVPGSGNTGTAIVDANQDLGLVNGDITFLSTFVVDSVTYTVTSISDYAFSNGSLTSVTISNTVTSIGAYAFDNNAITSVNIGSNVTIIGNNAFQSNQISSLIIPNKVTEIRNNAFQSNQISSLTIGTDVTTIGLSTFQSNLLTTLFIPVSVTTISNLAFKSNRLTKVYFFNIPTMGSASTAFTTNIAGIIAYYIDTSTSTQINNLPSTFTALNKIPMTRIELLKNHIIQLSNPTIQANSVEYLLSDNFTLAEMISADAPANWLLSYYTQQQLVDANFSISKLLFADGVSPLSLFNCGVSVATLKSSNANTKVMINQFALPVLLEANYTVAELKSASESVIVPVVTPDKQITIANLKLYNANVLQMLGSYTLSQLISNDYRVATLLDANPTISLPSFVNASAPLWDLMNNYAISTLVPYFTVVQLINSSNEKLNGVFKVTDTAKQSLDLKIGTLKTASVNTKQMMNYFILTDLITAGYTVSELKTASESVVAPLVTPGNKVTVVRFRLANANVSQMLNAYPLSDLIAGDYRVATLLEANSTLTLTNFVSVSTPLWDLLNVYSLYDLLAYPFTVAQLIAASNEKDAQNNYKVTRIEFQQLGTKADKFKAAGNASVTQMLGSFSLTALFAADYRVAVLSAANPSLTLPDFVSGSPPLWDLMNNYSLSSLVPYYTLDQLIISSNEKVDGVFKVTNAAKQSLDTKAETMKNAGANIKEMLNAYVLSVLITIGYNVIDLINASDDTNAPVVTASNTVTVTKFREANAPKTEMMNAYSLADLFLYGYSVVEIIDTSKITVSGVYTVTNPNKQALDTKPQILKSANAPVTEMLNYFSLATLMNTPVNYTVAQLKQASESSDVLEANKVSVSKFRTTFASIDVALNTSLISMTGSYSLAELVVVYTVSELAGYDSTITIAQFYNASANVAQMMAYFQLADLISNDIYSVQTFLSNSKTPQSLIDNGMPLWKMLNHFGGSLGYLRQANSATTLLSITQLLDAVANSNTDANKKNLIATSFYLGSGAPFSKPSNVDTPTLAQVTSRNYDIFNNSTLIQLLKVTDYSIDYIITTGNDVIVTNASLKNLTVQSFKDASKNDPENWIHDNRASNFIDYFSLSDLVSDWSVYELLYRGTISFVSAGKVVTLARLKIANAPVWDMLNNFTLTQLVSGGYTSTELVTASSDGRVTENANKNITLTSMISAGAVLYDLMNYYTLAELIAVPYSVAELIAESIDKDAQNNYKVTNINYQQLDTKASTFKAANALLSQMVNSFSLSDLVAADYRVKDLNDTHPAYTLLNFVNVPTPLWDMLNYYTLTQLYTYYSVLDLKNSSYDGRVTLEANQSLTVPKFKANSAPLWDMLNAYTTLADLVPYYTSNELITASQDNRVTVTANQNLTLTKFQSAGEDLWDLMNAYTLFELLAVNYLITDLVTASQDNRVTVTANQNLTIAKFKVVNTSNNKLWDLVNYYSLTDLVSAGYTVNELKTTINDVRVISDKTITIARLKIASASIPQMLNAYPLADLITAGYTVDELITASTDASVITADNNVTIAKFKLASASIPQMLNAYPLADLISAGYTVDELITASADALVTSENKVTIPKFKLANASIPQMLNAYLLSQLISAYYTVASLINASTDALVATVNKVTIAKFKLASAPITEMLNAYPLADLISAEYTVDELISSSADDLVTAGNKVTIAKFKLASASIPQMLNAYHLANLISAGYTVDQLITASADALVTADNKVTIATFKLASALITQMLNAYPLADLISAGYTVNELITASADASVTPDNKISIAKFKLASASIPQMLNAYSLADLIIAGYTVADLIAASADALVTAGNKVTIAKFKLASASIPQMLNAYPLADLISAGYTVDELITASADALVIAGNKVNIAKLKAASASIPQMLNAYLLADLITAGYTVADLIAASANAIVTDDNKVTIAKFKLAVAPIWEMLDNYALSSLVSAGYTTSELVITSADARITRTANKNISLGTIITAGAPLYDLMNFYTLAQLIAPPASYSVAALINASNLKDGNNNYRVNDTDYQQLGLKPATFKGINANITQVIGSFTLANLIAVDYRVQIIKNNSSYTIANFKAASAPLWDMLNNYTLESLINNGYTVAELKLASQDVRSTVYVNISPQRFVEATTVTDYVALATDILNNFTLAQVTSPGFRVSQLITYSRDVRVTVSANQNLVIDDFKTRSNAPTWDILLNYSIAELVTAGYTVAQLKLTIPNNASLPLSKQVTIATLKIGAANLQDIINNYTLRELVDNSLAGGYTLTELITASDSTSEPLVTDDHKITLARLLALTPLPAYTYFLTHYTTLELIQGGVSQVALANIDTSIIGQVEALGYKLIITTPQLLSVSVVNGIAVLSLNQKTGSDVNIAKYFVSHSNDNEKTFTPFTALMDITQTPNVPQLGNTLYVSGLTVGRYYSFRIMALCGTVYSAVSNTIHNILI